MRMEDFHVKRDMPGTRADSRSENLLFAALRQVLGTGAGPAFRDIGPYTSDCLGDVLMRSGKEFIDSMAAQGFQLLGATEAEIGLEERTKCAVRRALLLEHDRVLIREAFAAQGIEMLFFKGALCDPLWWGGQGMRGATDIDVLIPRSSEDAATSILINIGYERRRIRTHPATEDAAKERLFHHPDSQSRFPVDLHLGEFRWHDLRI